MYTSRGRSRMVGRDGHDMVGHGMVGRDDHDGAGRAGAHRGGGGVAGPDPAVAGPDPG